MSLSWRDRVSAFVGPQLVRVRRHSGGWRRTGEGVTVEVDGMPTDGSAEQPDRMSAEAAGTALQEALQETLQKQMPSGTHRHSCCHIVLSNQYLRYAIVEQASALRSAPERAAAALQTMRSIYGDAAHEWEIVMDDGTVQTALVAGISRHLMQSLQTAASAVGCASVRIEPLFTCALNGSLRQIGKDASAFVVLEPGCVVFAMVDDHGLASVRKQRLDDHATIDAAVEVAALAQRTHLLVGAPAGRSTVVLASEQAMSLAFPPEAGLQLRQIPLPWTLRNLPTLPGGAN